ncbi:hypothetical protein ONZ43_g7009 [Nemania bipapillata]|uniref:Uncharacterized protein n=1 Tax=Nemania bipapillata TaxID=110536 RepID=A0ACC2HUZ7_9PEZI|nr:hypothetical protein ONZ43_g7009 [Nemania bipapillata]
MFLPLEKIAAISYTNVLQRTFNMVVEVFTGEGGDEEATEELEFAMLDQEDYNGINENYVTRHKLQDRSLADQRKAKQELIENSRGKKGEGEQEANGGVGEDGMTELQRAQLEAEQQLQDEEDEDEEDYDPGSEGDSEGSGTSDDDDDDDDDDADEDEEEDEEDE